MSSKEVGWKTKGVEKKQASQFVNSRITAILAEKKIMIMNKSTQKHSDPQEKALTKRLRNLNNQKKLSYSLAGQLFFIPDEKRLYNPHTEDAKLMKKQYRNAMWCSSTLVGVMKDGKVEFHGERCKCRICTSCLRARTAKLIKAYKEPLSQIDDLHFVTLTAPTVTWEELPTRMEEFRERWKKITNSKCWRRNKPSGIRKTECTLRPYDHYHYHFHILIGGKENAEWLINKWLELSPTSERIAQDMRPVRKGDDGAIEEIFKYFTKFISKDGSEEKIGMDAVAKGVKKKYYVDLPRLDGVMYLMRKKSVFQTFGGIKAVNEDDFEETEDLGLPLEYNKREFTWHKEEGYRDSETKEQLVAGYKAPSWIDILVGEVDEDLLRKRDMEFRRDLVGMGISPHIGGRKRRRDLAEEWRNTEVDFSNLSGWGALNTEAVLLPQALEPPKQEREDLEAPPLYEPMGITDRRSSGCRCISAERQNKGIEIYLDM